MEKKAQLISTRRVARNVFWNLLGAGAPLLVALYAIPLLVDGLGTARFGVLTLAWMVVGYFNLFDLGLGRALTKLVAEKLGKGKNEEVPSLIWTAISLMALLGFLGTLVVAILTPWIVGHVLKVPPNLQSETVAAFYLLASAIPFVICATGMRGILEAYQRFRLINVVRIPVGILVFLGPLAALYLSHSLIPVVGALVVTRIVSCGAYVFLCLNVAPALRHGFHVNRAMINPLINFGGWITVTNVIGPLMAYMDRFLVGAIISIAAVAYYTTPYDLVTKLWIIPGAIMGVVFPIFSSSFAIDSFSAALLFRRTVGYVFSILFPLVIIVLIFSEEGLMFWLGEEFSTNSTVVLQILAVGVLVNSLAHVPLNLIQASGRPDLVAKILFFELPFYLISLWFFLKTNGIVGAAIVWSIRILVDTLIYFFFANKILPNSVLITWRLLFVMLFSVFVTVLSVFIESFFVKVVWVVAVLTCFLYIVWKMIMGNSERGKLVYWFNKTLRVNM